MTIPYHVIFDVLRRNSLETKYNKIYCNFCNRIWLFKKRCSCNNILYLCKNHYYLNNHFECLFHYKINKNI